MKKFKNFLTMIILFFSFLLLVSVWWAMGTFDNISLDEIVFHLKVPMAGSDTSYFIKYFINAFIPTIIITILLKKIFVREYKCNYSFKIKLKKLNKELNLNFLANKLFYLILLFLFSLYYTISKFELVEYIGAQVTQSSFIERNYVDPRKVELKFPKEKRNLIYIYLESMESSYSNIKNGGLQKENYIPNLTEIAYDNIHFSSSDDLSGFFYTPGANWTMGAMVAQTSGIPLKFGITSSSNSGTFLPGVITLGDILEKEGYNQMIMFGSNAKFAGRKTYFQTHGNYKIYDLYEAIKNEKMTKEEIEWWGFDDKNLYEYAKEELIKLSNDTEPFNFSLLTVETHAPNGYLRNDCKQKYDNQYANVISCADDLVKDFIDWLKEQDFYNDTTIVIVGDHLTMDSLYIENNNDDKRTIYNAFINSETKPSNVNNREFLAYDLFPTTLAAMGVKIEGEQLGLGVNLFSDKKTLTESFGYDYLKQELVKKSVYYNNKFLLKK